MYSISLHFQALLQIAQDIPSVPSHRVNPTLMELSHPKNLKLVVTTLVIILEAILFLELALSLALSLTLSLALSLVLALV